MKKLNKWLVIGCCLGVVGGALLTSGSASSGETKVIVCAHLGLLAAFVGLWLGAVFCLTESHDEPVGTTTSQPPGDASEPSAPIPA